MQYAHTRWLLFGALVAGIGALAVFWAVVLANPEGETVPASGGRYVEGVTRAPERINPIYAGANPTDQDLVALTFSGLVRIGADGAPEPDLAERWEITGNGTSYVFHLRRGLAWQDDPSARIDADDVVFTYRAISDPGFRGDPALAEVLRGVVVTARDPFTVEFKLEQAYAPFLSFLSLGILPEHLLGGMDADELYNAPFNAQPIGSGPYRVRGRTKDGGAVLDSNSTYHFGPPLISSLEVRVYADDVRLAEALRSGEVDGALLGPSVPDAEIEFLREHGRVTLNALPATTLHVVYLNTRAPPFDDGDVRAALQRALNVPAVVANATGGRGTPAQAWIPEFSWAYTAIDVPGFNPGAAASDLEVAGWSRGSDGVRRKGGVRLSFALSTSNDPQRVRIAEEVARQWRAVGAEVDVQPLDATTYLQEHVLGRRFQAALVEVAPGADPDPYPFWHSTQIAAPGRNLAGFSDPTLDDVLERGRQTTDQARRKELYELFEDFIVGAAPSLPLFAPQYVYAQDERVRGFEPAPLFGAASRFHNVNAWFVRTRVE